MLKQGTTKHADPQPGPGDEEVDPEELMKREVTRDPWEPRLKAITEDTQTKGKNPAWLLRGYNLNTDQVDPKTGKVTVNYGTVVVKSMFWPGSFTLYNQGRTQQIYLGNGQKTEPYETTFYPVKPPVMRSDRRKEKTCYAKF